MGLLACLLGVLLRVDRGRVRPVESFACSVLPSPVGTRLVGETRRGEVRFGHVCLPYGTWPVPSLCAYHARDCMYKSEYTRQVQVAGASASCQGLSDAPSPPPTSSRKRFRPALSLVLPPTPARLPTCCAPARFRTRALPRSPTTPQNPQEN